MEKLNVFENMAKVIEAFTEMEGDEPMSNWNGSEDQFYSLANSVKWLIEYRNGYFGSEIEKMDKKTGRTPKISMCIYGAGRINEYYLQFDGSIKFSEWRALLNGKEKDTKKAKEFGFEIKTIYY